MCPYPVNDRRVISGVSIGDDKVDNQHRYQYEPVHDNLLISIFAEELWLFHCQAAIGLSLDPALKRRFFLFAFVLAGNGGLGRRSRHRAVFFVHPLWF